MRQSFVSILLAVLAPMALAEPLSLPLGDLSTAEKANAALSVNLDASVSSGASEQAREVARLWNYGQYGAALELLGELEEQVGPGGIELCIDWKTPVSSPAPLWGNDVLINPRDSIFSVSLTRHPSSGTLFAVLSWWSGANKGTSVNFSDDGGYTWSETYSGYSSGQNYKSSGVVLGNYYYFAYIFNNGIRLRRRYASTGQEAPFRDGTSFQNIYTATADTIDEVRLADWSTTQLFCGTLHNRGRLNMFWTGDTGGVDWQQFNSPESTARRGLDMHGNLPYAHYYLFLSYYTDAAQMRILGLGPGLNWDTLWTVGASPGGYYTATGAYRDTVVVAFEDSVAGIDRIRYFVTYDGGQNWVQGTISSADTHAYCPDIAMRGGGGTGVAYYQDQTMGCRFKWRPNVGAWTTYTGISDATPHTSYQPSIEYLESGYYGIAYISDNADLRHAYFDRSDWTGVAQGPGSELNVGSLMLLPNAPNPFRRTTTIKYQLTRPGRVRLKVYNAAGQCVRDLTPPSPPFDLSAAANAKAEGSDSWVGSVVWDGRDNQGGRVASGVYLYRLEAGGEAATGRMTVVR